MAPQPGVDKSAKNGRKRPIQPVIPVVPFVAPRKTPVARKIEEKENTEAAPTTEAQPVARPPATPESSVQTSKLENGDVVEEQVQEIAGKNDITEVIASGIATPNTSEPFTNGVKHEVNHNTTPLHLEQEPVVSAPTGEQHQFLAHSDESSLTEDISSTNQTSTDVRDESSILESVPTKAERVEFANNLIIEDVAEGIEITPTEEAKEVVTVESGDAKSLGRLPHRKSEAAPEVLANGHSRQFSAFATVVHESKESISSQPAPIPTIYDHFLYLFNAKQLCDTIIQVNSSDLNAPPAIHYAHSILLIRSERMAKFLPESDQQTQPRIINLFPPRNIQPYAFEAALRFLYSDHVLSADALFPKEASLDKEARTHLLDYLMSYWAAGVELGLEPVKSRACDFLKDFLDWDVVELVLKEANVLRSKGAGLDGSVLSEATLISKTILLAAITFFVEHLNLTEFVLDTEAHPMDMVGRFAQLELGRGMTNPALASMVFGSMPSQLTAPSSPESVASAILLNSDFEEFEPLAANLISWHGSDALRVLNEVVEEREKRRAHFIGNRMIPNKQRLSNSVAWEAAGWREYMGDETIKRERVGFLLPTKLR